MHYSAYRYSMQALQDAVQQLMLVPLDEMEKFLVAADGRRLMYLFKS